MPEYKKIDNHRKLLNRECLVRLGLALLLAATFGSAFAPYSDAQVLGDVFSTNTPFAGIDPLKGQAEIMPIGSHWMTYSVQGRKRVPVLLPDVLSQ